MNEIFQEQYYEPSTPRKEVVAIIIVGIDKNTRYILFDCDVGNRHPFRFIGGKVDPTDLSLKHAIVREINEEIGVKTYPDILFLSEDPSFSISTKKISGSSGLLTDYQIHVFSPLSFIHNSYFSYSGVSGRRTIWMNLSTFSMLMERVPDIFFRQTISKEIIKYIHNTKILYRLSSQELSFSL